MLRQLSAVDTLVPPNFSTTQGWRFLDTVTRALIRTPASAGARKSIL
jgi:hypothetical protein